MRAIAAWDYHKEKGFHDHAHPTACGSARRSLARAGLLRGLPGRHGTGGRRAAAGCARRFPGLRGPRRCPDSNASRRMSRAGPIVLRTDHVGRHASTAGLALLVLGTGGCARGRRAPHGHVVTGQEAAKPCLRRLPWPLAGLGCRPGPSRAAYEARPFRLASIPLSCHWPPVADQSVLKAVVTCLRQRCEGLELMSVRRVLNSVRVF